MPINDINDWLAAPKQIAVLNKLASITAVAANWSSTIHLAGNPGAGTLAGTSLSNGVVPTAAAAGYPTLNAFGVGASGYISGIDFGSTVPCRLALYDRLFLGGAYGFNANQSLTSQPSFASRVPGGTDFKGLELWIEQVTAGSGVQNVTTTYENQDGVSKSTGTVATAANIVGRCWQIPLAAGDTGVSKITQVQGTVASAGTFNVMVLRPLWSGCVRVANDANTHDMFMTGMPEIYENSALYMLVAPNSTATGLPDLAITVANG